jgi:hypothetical protein
MRNSIHAKILGVDTAAARGLVVRGAAPTLTLCRALVGAGHDPATPMLVYRGAVLCLSIRTIGEGARLTVEDRPSGGKPPRFIRYRPMPDRAEGSPPIASGAAPDQFLAGAAE